jgi:hypothetical protein
LGIQRTTQQGELPAYEDLIRLYQTMVVVLPHGLYLVSEVSQYCNKVTEAQSPTYHCPAVDPPPLKWSALRYDFEPEEDRDGEQEAPA